MVYVEEGKGRRKAEKGKRGEKGGKGGKRGEKGEKGGKRGGKGGEKGGKEGKRGKEKKDEKTARPQRRKESSIHHTTKTKNTQTGCSHPTTNESIKPTTGVFETRTPRKKTIDLSGM